MQRCEKCDRPITNRRWCSSCGLLAISQSTQRPKLTRREWLIWLSVAGNVAQVIQTGISIHDHRHPKPPVTPIGRVVAVELTAKVTASASLSASITGVAAIAASGTVTASGTVVAPPALLETSVKTSSGVRIPAAAPINVRRALWQMHVHPKRLPEVPAGRLRWKQLQFPNAPDKWAN